MKRSKSHSASGRGAVAAPAGKKRKISTGSKSTKVKASKSTKSKIVSQDSETGIATESEETLRLQSEGNVVGEASEVSEENEKCRSLMKLKTAKAKTVRHAGERPVGSGSALLRPAFQVGVV